MLLCSIQVLSVQICYAEGDNIQIMYSQGPNVLNLNAYTNEDHQPRQENEQEEEGMIDSQAIEDKFEAFVKDIQRYDEIITKVGKNVDEVSAEEYFITDFYPGFVFQCTYQMDEEKRVIASNDPQMARMMENLERGNKNLKEQLKSWLFEYSKKTRLTEVLLTENKILRKYVSEKNKEIVKLIETIKNAENEELTSLRQNLNELKEQNGVLLDHLKSIKEELKEKNDEEKKIIIAYDKAQRDKMQIQTKITQGEDEQEHYSKMVALLEGTIEEAKRREKKLLSEKERLTKLKQQYTEDEQAIDKEIQACQIDREDIENHLKKKFKGHQTQKQKIMDEIEDHTEKIQKSKQETRDFQQQISKNEHRIDEYTKLNKELDKKITELEETITTGKKQVDSLLETETQYLSDIDMINFDIDVLKEQLKELEELEEQDEAKFKSQMKVLEDEKKQEITKWNQQLNKTQREVSMRVLQEKSDLAIKKREVEDVERKVLDKKAEIEDLRAQMKEIKENQMLMTSLREKLKAAERR